MPYIFNFEFEIWLNVYDGYSQDPQGCESSLKDY